jgi:hypothetical protein
VRTSVLATIAPAPTGIEILWLWFSIVMGMFSMDSLRWSGGYGNGIEWNGMEWEVWERE